MSLTWKQFKEDVRSFLTVDNTREGAQDFIEKMIRQGVIELQTYIMPYRKGHESLYLPSDFVVEGHASKGTLPPQAEVQDAVLVSITDADTTTTPARHGQVKRWHLDTAFGWENRFDLIHGKRPLNNQTGVLCIDPYANTFYVYPIVTAGHLVSLFWDGLRLDFCDAEITPFDEGATLAVAEFVKAKLAREVDKSLEMHNSYMQSYMAKRKELYVTATERLRSKRK